MNDDKDAFLSDVAPEPRRGGVIRREVLEAQQEAARIVESARGEAEAVLARAREEAAALRAEAEARGHSEGIDRVARIVARLRGRAGGVPRCPGTDDPPAGPGGRQEAADRRLP
jgi:hypothetical protein